MFAIYHIGLVAAWALYGALHSLLAALPVKHWLMDRLGKYAHYYRMAYAVVAIITLALLLAYHFSIVSPLMWKPGPAENIGGTVLLMAGVAIMVICARKYFAWMVGIDIFFRQAVPHTLEQHGLHRYMRHPLYTGTFLFIWSLFLLAPRLSNLITCACITVYTLIGISLEEKKLMMEFGDDYRQYAKKVARIIPGIF